MNYLQRTFKGKKLQKLFAFINYLEIEGSWGLHIFVLQSEDNKPLYYFQMYNEPTGALILIKTHRIVNKSNNYLDMEIKDFYSADKFIVDKVMTKTINDVEDATKIENFFRHIETLLLQ